MSTSRCQALRIRKAPTHAGPSPRERQYEVFYTPQEAITPLFPHLTCLAPGRVRACKVLEPAAGSGNINRELIAAGVPRRNITSVEIREEERAALAPCSGRVIIDDFRCALAHLGKFDLIIANPPFSLMVDYAKACLPSLREGGTLALFGRLAFLESAKRRQFHLEHPAQVLVHPRRFSFTANGKADVWAYAWFYWGANHPTVHGGTWRIL